MLRVVEECTLQLSSQHLEDYADNFGGDNGTTCWQMERGLVAVTVSKDKKERTAQEEVSVE